MHRAFAGLFVAVALVVPAWTGQAQSPEALIRMALEAEDRGQLDDAMELHKAVVAAQPDDVLSGVVDELGCGSFTVMKYED